MDAACTVLVAGRQALMCTSSQGARPPRPVPPCRLPPSQLIELRVLPPLWP